MWAQINHTCYLRSVLIFCQYLSVTSTICILSLEFMSSSLSTWEKSPDTLRADIIPNPRYGVLVQSRRMSLRGETGPFTESHPHWLDWFIGGVYPCTPPPWMDWSIRWVYTRWILCMCMPTHVCALSWPYPANFNQCNCIQPTSRNSTIL